MRSCKRSRVRARLAATAGLARAQRRGLHVRGEQETDPVARKDGNAAGAPLLSLEAGATAESRRPFVRAVLIDD